MDEKLNSELPRLKPNSGCVEDYWFEPATPRFLIIPSALNHPTTLCIPTDKGKTLRKFKVCDKDRKRSSKLTDKYKQILDWFADEDKLTKVKVTDPQELAKLNLFLLRDKFRRKASNKQKNGGYREKSTN